MKSPLEKRCGFTMIELLVVIGIMTLLAGLLLPALARGTAGARLARCANNLRQIGLATSLYVSDHRAFPLFSEYGRPPRPGTFWSDRLQPYTHQTWAAEGIYRCPSYPEANRLGVFTADAYSPPKGSYDMNGFGLSVLGALGIGGRMEGLRKARTPCQESQVAVPSQMIGYGDVIAGYPYSRGSYFGFTLYHPPKEWSPEQTRKARKTEAHRHLGRFNVVFIDNHIESSKPDQLFAATDENLSRWNNDHQPHRQEIYPWGE